jgi:hypothetical protein
MTEDRDAATQAQLDELAHATGQPEGEVVAEAVRVLHRALIGLPPGRPDAPTLPTGGFRKRYGDRRAEVTLRQVDAARFELLEPFRYDVGGVTRWVVPPSDVTDLASVPNVLTWLVPRYGRHTYAAILHDHLQRHDIDGPVPSDEADTVFRDAMAGCEVPLLARWLMWSAVSARTRFRSSGAASAVATAIWAIGYAVLGALGAPVLVALVLTGTVDVGVGALAAAAVVLSVPLLALAWRGPEGYRFGLLSGLALLAIGFPALVDLIVFGAYSAVETASRAFQARPAPIRRKLAGRPPDQPDGQTEGPG